MYRTITKTLATAAFSTALLAAAATPALASPTGLPLQPATPGASQQVAGDSSGSSLTPILIWPLGLSSALLCKGEPGGSPICQLIYAVGSGSSE
ncbi:hypothetical protein [Nocardia acidivorans]|uniref:hypothetical protein n=1 Tax=Nocardia acidivorans TaxID=404580 RepID=UPI0008348DF2|nr:hypothetical protein [Nocardia acidivorans]